MAPPTWLALESNPDVMNEFMSKCGLDTSQHRFVDVYGLEEDTLAFLNKPQAFILLFPQADVSQEGNKGDPEVAEGVYYTKQTISNACGTVAMIHAVANNEDKLVIKDDSPLKKFLQATKDLSPAAKAEHLEQNEELGQIHDEMAKSGQTSPGDPVEHHFVAFVLRNGVLWELDGRKAGPIKVAEAVDESSFALEAAKACKAYVQNEPGSIAFSVIALTAA